MATPAELVGRQAELERLRDSLDQARRGSGSLVLVAGEAGVGETRLAEPLGRLRLLVVGAYRSDGLPRDHTLRRLRHELRRGGRLEELALDPLGESETGELLAEILEGAPARSLTRTIHDRTEGIPFYVEELARALLLTGSLTPGRHGLELSKAGEVPLPSSVRDAVLIGASELSDAARTAADVAAAAGEAFDLDLVAGLSS